MSSFSSRHGFESAEPEITIREDAPHDLRGVVVDLAYESGSGPGSLRKVVCRTLRVRPDEGNWSPFPNIDMEVRQHLDSAQWNEVYDIIEGMYRDLIEDRRGGDHDANPKYFADELNKYFRNTGIGWQLVDGQIQTRGTEAFETAVKDSSALLANAGKKTASTEIHEALQDLSRRPKPDITGALQHGLAALECVMRDVTGDAKSTLGVLLSKHKGLIPPPLDQAVEKAWGYASEQGRHLREGREPTADEARLTVHIAAAVSSYLSRKDGR